MGIALAPNPPELKENRQADQDIKWFEIYSDTPNTYQADLTFHKVRKSIGGKSGYVQQAIFCIININTCFAAAWPLQLVKKKIYDKAYKPTTSKKRNKSIIRQHNMRNVFKNNNLCNCMKNKNSIQNIVAKTKI